jgi:hypothetical protein
MEWAPDFASTPEIRARLHAELTRDMSELSAKQAEHGVTAANDQVERLCDSCQDLAWALANTVPTSIAGVAALLRYANECEGSGEEWPDTDTIGSEGWHYQLRQTAAAGLVATLTESLGNVGVTVMSIETFEPYAIPDAFCEALAHRTHPEPGTAFSRLPIDAVAH